jgi:hypothetical protein
MTHAVWCAALAASALACTGRPQASAARRAEVAARGATVMPFDLSRTRHVFLSQPDGGLQTVTANDPRDTAQVRLIQAHLQEEAARFSRGDFTDPMAIHGHSMPGIQTLREGAAAIRVEYTPQNDGGRIRYSTADPALIEALHRWFEAQRMDHGTG